MSAPHMILDCLSSQCEKLSELVVVWRSCNKNNFACFFSETRCRWYMLEAKTTFKKLTKSKIYYMYISYDMRRMDQW